MTGEQIADALISTESLSKILGEASVSVMDSSFYLPGQGRNPDQEYLTQHIPGALRFDIDVISDRTSSLPHMLPALEDFERIVGALGIGNDDHVVLYDSNPVFGSGRAWWMLKTFGHRRVSILDGGLPKWIKEGRPVTSELAHRNHRQFTAKLDPPRVASIDKVMSAIDKRAQIVDARAAARFAGRAPEPRPGLRLGHMPGALNLPYSDLVDGESGCMRSRREIQARISAVGIDPSQPVIVSCGSGITACVVALGLHLVGAENVSVYDGSWAEWGSMPDTPIISDPS